MERLKSNLKSQSAITLVALVVTIVVLLILAGVTIATLIGNNGILNQLRNAKKKLETSTLEEKIKLIWTECEMDYRLNQGEKKDYFSEDYLNSKLKEGNITDVKYNINNESSLVYHDKDNKKYYVEIHGEEVTITEDLSSLSDKKTWTGCTDCSEENPHIITNKYEFDSIRTHINVNAEGKEYIGGHFKLANDIVFYNSDFIEGGDFYNYNERTGKGEGFIPIGLKEGPYDSLWTNKVYSVKIDLDGNNKTLKNIKITTSENQRDYNAIIARLDDGAKVYNLQIENLYVYASTSVGSLARTIYEGSEVTNVTIKNSHCIAYKNMRKYEIFRYSGWICKWKSEKYKYR